MASRAVLANVLAKQAVSLSPSPLSASVSTASSVVSLDDARSREESAFRAGASVLVERLRFAQSVFEQFDGKRNFWKSLGYVKHPEFEDFVDQYERGDIAQRIVDIPAEETWFAFPKVTDDSGEKGTFAKAWDRLSRRLNLPEAFCRLDRAAGLGRYGVALVGVRDGKKLVDEVGVVSSPEDVLYVSVFTEGSSSFGSPVEDPTSPQYGKPALYFLDLSRGAADLEFHPGTPTGSRKTTQGNQPTWSRGTNLGVPVHSSRVLHLAEGRMESDLFGIPRLMPVFNRLYDLAKIVGASGESFWLAVNRGLHANIDPTVVRQIKKSDLDRLSEDLELYRDQMVRVLRTTGVAIKDLGSDTINPRGPFAVVAAIISGTTKIPHRMLFPETRGAQTSSYDRVAFREEVVLQRQVRVAEPQIIRPFISMLVKIGAMPAPVGGDYDVIWPDPVSRSRVDNAEIALKISEAAWRLSQARENGGVLPRERELELLGFRQDIDKETTFAPTPDEDNDIDEDIDEGIEE